MCSLYTVPFAQYHPYPSRSQRSWWTCLLAEQGETGSHCLQYRASFLSLVLIHAVGHSCYHVTSTTPLCSSTLVLFFFFFFVQVRGKRCCSLPLQASDGCPMSAARFVTPHPSPSLLGLAPTSLVVGFCILGGYYMYHPGVNARRKLAQDSIGPPPPRTVSSGPRARCRAPAPARAILTWSVSRSAIRTSTSILVHQTLGVCLSDISPPAPKTDPSSLGAPPQACKYRISP